MEEIKKKFKESFGKELDKIGKALEEIYSPLVNKIEKLNDEMYDLEMPYNDVIDDLKGIDTKGMKAKEKKELQKKLKEESLNHLKKNYPNIVKGFNQVNLIIEGINELFKEQHQKIEELVDELEEIETLQDDLQQRKNELDF